MKVDFETYNQELDEAERQIANGEFISHEDLIEKIEWWNDEKVVADFNKRVDDFENGTDKGFSLAEIQNEISKKRVANS